MNPRVPWSIVIGFVLVGVGVGLLVVSLVVEGAAEAKDPAVYLITSGVGSLVGKGVDAATTSASSAPEKP